MGRPYKVEMQQLSEVYALVAEMNIDPLREWLKSISDTPLITVASGGSLTAALMLGHLHHKYTGQISKCLTPLEMADSLNVVQHSNVVVFSASGKNEDVLSIFELLARNEPKHLLGVCGRHDSKLKAVSEKYEYVDFFEFDLSHYKDGFLATSSLVAFCFLIERAYSELYLLDSDSPDFSEIARETYECRDIVRFLQLDNRKTLVVLYDPELKSSAYDLESRLIEAGLINTQLSDLRNFGHGRHHWLAKHGSSSSVIIFTTNARSAFGDKIMKILPEDVPCKKIEFSEKARFLQLKSIVFTMYLTLYVGDAVSIDPGRPGVPEFGRKMYHLKGAYKANLDISRDTRKIALIRKKRVLDGSIDDNTISESLDSFVRRLAQSRFKAIIFDYDGTICRHSERFSGISELAALHLTRLLDSGIYIGIATGRGRSVREAMRKVIPERLWGRVLVGYYNCGIFGLINDDSQPDVSLHPHPILEEVKNRIDKSDLLSGMTIEVRPKQITITCSNNLSYGKIVEQLIGSIGKDFPAVSIVSSTHSIDILAPDVNKITILNEINNLWGIDVGAMLTIGDQGKWPGNDYALLDSPYSLSVDTVSSSMRSCWNIAPPGIKGVQATLHYLGCLIPDGSDGTVAFQGKII